MPTFAFRPTGAVLDVPPEAAPADAWTGVTDATFEAGITTRPAGEVREYYPNASLIALPFHIQYAGPDSAATPPASNPRHCWWYTGNTIAGPNIRVHEVRDDGTAANRTPVAWAAAVVGSVANVITSGVLNGVAFVSVLGIANGVAQGLPGLGAALATFVPAAGDSFRAVRSYRYQLVGLGVANGGVGVEYPTRVNWTASAAPGAFPSTWAAAAGNDAGSFDVPYCRGYLVDGGQLGEDFMIYAQGSTHVMTYVGGTEIMQLRGVSAESGMLAANCWADVGVGHVVLTGSDVVLATSGGVQSIADGLVRRTLFGPLGAISQTHASARHAHLVYHRPRREVWVCYSSGNAEYCDNALVWHIPTGKWGHRTLASRQRSAAAGRTRLFDLEQRTPEVTLTAGIGLEAALTDGRLFLADEPSGSTYQTRSPLLQRWDMDLGEPGRVKTVRAIRPRFQEQGAAVTGIEVRAGGRNSATEAIAWSSWATYAPTVDDTVHLFATGRLISVELRHSSGTKPWRLTGLDIDFDLRGRW